MWTAPMERQSCSLGDCKTAQGSLESCGARRVPAPVRLPAARLPAVTPAAASAWVQRRWAWAFGCFALGMMAFLTASQRAAPYKAAFWSLLIASASYNLCSIIHWVLLYSESKVAGDAFK